MDFDLIFCIFFSLSKSQEFGEEKCRINKAKVMFVWHCCVRRLQKYAMPRHNGSMQTLFCLQMAFLRR